MVQRRTRRSEEKDEIKHELKPLQSHTLCAHLKSELSAPMQSGCYWMGIDLSQTCWQISSVGRILLSRRALDFQEGSQTRPLTSPAESCLRRLLRNAPWLASFWSERAALITDRTYGVTNRNKQHVLLVRVKGGRSWHRGSNLFSRYTEQSGWGRLCVWEEAFPHAISHMPPVCLEATCMEKKLGVACWNRAPF